MADRYQGQANGSTGPALDWFDITPADADLAEVPRALTCLTTGNVDIVSSDGSRVTILLTEGGMFACRPVRVLAPTTGTAATGIVGLI